MPYISVIVLVSFRDIYCQIFGKLKKNKQLGINHYAKKIKNTPSTLGKPWQFVAITPRPTFRYRRIPPS